MLFYITVSSKSKKTLKLFLLFISKLKTNSLIIKYFPKQKIKKVITILKSPHVNKSAQEQFEFRVYTKKILFNCEQTLKFLYFLKKIQNNLFPFINLKVKSIIFDKNRQFNLKLKKLNPINVNTNFFHQMLSNKKNTSNLHIITYLNLFDCYGELYMTTLTTVSS